MKEKMREFAENAEVKLIDFGEDHPYAYTGIVTAIGAVLFVPMMIALYKWYGKVEGKAIAKELAKAGVNLGYSHD